MNDHFPVMLNESIHSLNIKKNGVYIDLTFGCGGHSLEILKNLDKTGMLIAFDKDKSVIKNSYKNFLKIHKNFKFIHSDFKNIKNELKKIKIKKVDGIIADLGVSSPQINNDNRGFSYNKNAKLDMRMNQDQKLDAYEIINNYNEIKLINILKKYGNVIFAKKIAKGIIINRPIFTTLELVKIIKQNLPNAIIRKKNPAKTVFQAIRIAVNNELESLKIVLKDSISILKKNGSLLIISFHSLEDKIIKNYFNNLIKDETGKLPIIIEKKFKTKTIKPSQKEIIKNNKSRSAKLRVITKLKE